MPKRSIDGYGNIRDFHDSRMPETDGVTDDTLIVDEEKKLIWAPSTGDKVDDKLDVNSTNPVQNKVIADEFTKKIMLNDNIMDFTKFNDSLMFKPQNEGDCGGIQVYAFTGDGQVVCVGALKETNRVKPFGGVVYHIYDSSDYKNYKYRFYDEHGNVVSAPGVGETRFAYWTDAPEGTRKYWIVYDENIKNQTPTGNWTFKDDENWVYEKLCKNPIDAGYINTESVMEARDGAYWKHSGTVWNWLHNFNYNSKQCEGSDWYLPSLYEAYELISSSAVYPDGTKILNPERFNNLDMIALSMDEDLDPTKSIAMRFYSDKQTWMNCQLDKSGVYKIIPVRCI